MIRSFPHQIAIFAVAFSPDGKLLAGGGYDNERNNYFGRLWEVVIREMGQRVSEPEVSFATPRPFTARPISRLPLPNTDNCPPSIERIPGSGCTGSLSLKIYILWTCHWCWITCYFASAIVGSETNFGST